MVSLLQRRREMMNHSAPDPTLIYELSAPTSTANYDTNVKLFSTPMSFTILCSATFNNRNWSGSQTIFGTGTGNIGIRIGRATNYYKTTDNSTVTTTDSFYTAFVMNATGDTQTKKASALYSRAANTTPITRPLCVRYDHTTRKVQAFCSGSSNLPPNTIRWWTEENDLITSDSIKFNMDSAGSTINIFKVYSRLLSDQEILNFINKVMGT